MFSGTPLRLPIDVLPETTDGGRGLALLRHLDQSGGEVVLDRTKCVLPPPKSFAGFRVCKTGDFPLEAGENALQSLPEFMYFCPCQMDFHGVPPYIAVRSCRFPRRLAKITSADRRPPGNHDRRPRPLPTHPYAPMQRYRHVLSNKKRARGGNPSASPGAVPDSLWIIEGLSTGSTGTGSGWGRQGRMPVCVTSDPRRQNMLASRGIHDLPWVYENRPLRHLSISRSRHSSPGRNGGSCCTRCSGSPGGGGPSRACSRTILPALSGSSSAPCRPGRPRPGRRWIP